MTTTLYLSPRWGDAVLSCAGGICARRGSNTRVVVCTVFARTGDDDLDRSCADEDDTLHAYGIDTLTLDFTAAPARLPEPGYLTSLEAAVDDALADELRKTLATVIARVQPDEVWLPLAIGGDVDHRAVFATRDVFDQPRFYEDRPYAFVPSLRALRMVELIGGRAKSANATAIERELADHGCAMVAPLEARHDIARELARRLGEPHAGEVRALETTVHRHATDALPPACKLISGYATRVRELFGQLSVTELWTQLAADSAGWMEREIRLVPRD
ncbi:MAG TPA: hypothetical protein VFQ53_23230 [Kofleriaceae bacterium]|nr:hypothetical protein [Kofleriaceae bacterium]